MCISWFWAFWLMLVAATAAPAQTYTIKFKSDPVAGRSVVVREAKKETGSVKFFDAAGKLNEYPSTSDDKVYTETVLEQGPKEGSAAKFTRTFEKATETKGDKSRPFSYQGRTVVFERKKNKWWVGVVGKPNLDPEDLASFLERENTEQPSMRALVTPTGPVAVGDRWNISLKLLAAHFTSVEFNPKESKAECRLVKVYEKDKSRFGVLEVTMHLAIKGLAGLTAVEDTIAMEVKGTIEAAIDGSSTARTETFTIVVKGKGLFQRGDTKVRIEMDHTTAGRFAISAEQKAKVQVLPVVELTGPPGEWQEFTSKEGRFTADFPEKPQVEKKKDGKNLTTFYQVLQEKGALTYQIITIDSAEFVKGMDDPKACAIHVAVAAQWSH